MEIKIKTAYKLGQEIDVNGLKGKIVKIVVSMHLQNRQDIEYILDSGEKRVFSGLIEPSPILQHET